MRIGGKLNVGGHGSTITTDMKNDIYSVDALCSSMFKSHENNLSQEWKFPINNRQIRWEKILHLIIDAQQGHVGITTASRFVSAGSKCAPLELKAHIKWNMKLPSQNAYVGHGDDQRRVRAGRDAGEKLREGIIRRVCPECSWCILSHGHNVLHVQRGLAAIVDVLTKNLPPRDERRICWKMFKQRDCWNQTLTQLRKRIQNTLHHWIMDHLHTTTNMSHIHWHMSPNCWNANNTNLSWKMHVWYCAPEFDFWRSHN